MVGAPSQHRPQHAVPAHGGAGMGRFTGDGAAVSFRGALYFHGVTGTLARLNGVALLYEWEIDAQGNAQTPFWEWT